jgi:hypothetical protein
MVLYAYNIYTFNYVRMQSYLWVVYALCSVLYILCVVCWMLYATCSILYAACTMLYSLFRDVVSVWVWGSYTHIRDVRLQGDPLTPLKVAHIHQ